MNCLALSDGGSLVPYWLLANTSSGVSQLLYSTPLVKAWTTQALFLYGNILENSGLIGIFKSIASTPPPINKGFCKQHEDKGSLLGII